MLHTCVHMNKYVKNYMWPKLKNLTWLNKNNVISDYPKSAKNTQTTNLLLTSVIYYFSPFLYKSIAVILGIEKSYWRQKNEEMTCSPGKMTILYISVVQPSSGGSLIMKMWNGIFWVDQIFAGTFLLIAPKCACLACPLAVKSLFSPF